MAHRIGRETFFRSKAVVFTDRDELAFSRVIREFCPDVLFLGQSVDDGDNEASFLPSIAHDRDSETSICLPSPGQEKQWKINAEMRSLMVRPHVRFDLRRSKWEWLDPSKNWSFDLPLLGWGELVVGYPRDNEALKKFAGQLLRLANKVTARGNAIGLDACLWSQSGGEERRGLGGGQLIDPSEKIELNKYYDDSLWGDRLPETPAWDRNIEPPPHLKRRWGIE